MKLIKLTILVAIGLFTAPSFAAQEGMRIDQAWARASNTENSAVYMNIINTTEADDRLIGAKTDACEIVELHTVLKEGDVHKMRPVKAIEVPAGKTTTLEPGAFHVMLLNLKGALTSEKKVPLTLVFEKAGEVNVMADVRKGDCQCCDHGH